jgi:YegS/Rv2252/BmrU family lipid kinase
MPERLVFIANPRAGMDRAGRELPALIEALDARDVDYAIRATSHPRHAVELARQAAEDGATTVVAVGGDGTVNEVVNGLMGIEQSARPRLGVVAAGSGADFARTFDLPSHIDGSLKGVIGTPQPVDIGLMEFSDGSKRYFANIANVGLAAATVERAERLPRRLGKARYVIALWPVLASYDLCQITMEVDGQEVSEVAANVLIANGRFAGGNMRFSPHSAPDDGVLDTQMNLGPKRQAVTLVPKIFRGSHLPNKRIRQSSGARFEIDAERPLQVEADGEMLGMTPVIVTVVPGAIDLVV